MLADTGLAFSDPAEQPASKANSLIVEDITATASGLEGFEDHEAVLLGRDDERGLTAIIAIHDTTLGPALGGTRVWMHDSFDDAVTDALRLSRGMTLKAAIAGLPLGGGKAVIRANSKTDKTPELFDAYAEMLSIVIGRYVTAEDVGLTLDDADYLRARTPNVAGTTVGGSGNPSPFTAEGVFLGIKAAVRHKTGSDDLTGRTVAIQGLGAVGRALAERLHGAGTRLAVADLDAARCANAAEAYGAEIAAPEAIITAEADILAPCALGGVISKATIPSIRAGVVAGSANNQLLKHEDAAALKDRGILYAPDYVINAGGLINVAAEVDPGGYDRAKVMTRIGEIPATLAEIFDEADRTGAATNDVALEIATRRIAKGG